MVEELKVKIIPDISEVKRQLAGVGVVGTGGGGVASGGAGSKSEISLKKIAGGVFAGNLLLKGIDFILKALDPILKPLLVLMQILVLTIFRPLFPLFKLGMQALIRAFGLGDEDEVSLGEQAGEGLFPQEDIDRIKKVFPEIADDITVAKNFFQKMIDSLGSPTGLVDRIFASIEFLIDTIFGEGTTSKFVEGITKFAQELPGKLIEGISGVAGFISEAFDGIVTGLVDLADVGQDIFDEIFKQVSENLDPLAKFGQEVLDDLTEGLGSFASDISKGVSEFVDEIVNGLRNMGKSFINAIVEGINKIIDFINSLLAQIPFTTPIPKILPLAQGGIVTKPTLALIGERGPEAVIPLGRGGAGIGTTINQTFNIQALDTESMKKAIEEANREMLAEAKRQGTFVGRTFNA